MGIEMKYVVVRNEDGKESLFTFPKYIDHDCFAEVLSYIKIGGDDWDRQYQEPISAGFTDGKVCYGGSETLGVDSRKCDTTLLQNGGI